METFRWDPHFETGLEPVDRQHRSLVDLINRFSSCLRDMDRLDPSTIEGVFGELTDYARTHFETEKKVMEETGVDARHVNAHLQEHDSFLGSITRIREGSEGNLVACSQPLLDFLTHWLAYHMLHTDQSMAREIGAIRNGLDPAAAHDRELSMESSRTPLVCALSGLFELVSERNRQLFDLNRSLESKVKERTQALMEANQELHRTIDRLEAEQEQSRRLSQELATANIRLETMAMTDALTGLYNRRYALERLNSEFAAAQRHGTPLSLVLLDADGLKAVNDTYGHDAGDAVIRALGTALTQGFRTEDVVCRMGGDEFLVLCPHTDLDNVRRVAERVRASVAGLEIPVGSGRWRGSFSIGLASLSPDLTDAGALIKAADEAVYEAKRQGRNCVAVFRS